MIIFAPWQLKFTAKLHREGRKWSMNGPHFLCRCAFTLDALQPRRDERCSVDLSRDYAWLSDELNVIFSLIGCWGRLIILMYWLDRKTNDLICFLFFNILFCFTCSSPRWVTPSSLATPSLLSCLPWSPPQACCSRGSNILQGSPSLSQAHFTISRSSFQGKKNYLKKWRTKFNILMMSSAKNQKGKC